MLAKGVKKKFDIRGNFYMILNGDSVSSVRLRLNPEEAFFEPGPPFDKRFYTIIATNGVAQIKPVFGVHLVCKV